MGISKLSAFMKVKYNWQRLNIAGSKLVIDGNNLCHYLYHSENLEWRLGGSYPAFYDTVTQFFQTLTSHSITPFVVFEGIRNMKGNYASRKGNETYLHAILKSQGRQMKVTSFNQGVSPVFAKEVFLDALSDLDVEFYFVESDGEADGEITAIANYYNCPVLSSDSDFYIYDIAGGFVPLGLLQWEKKCTIPKCEVAVYHLSSFIKQFSLPNQSLRFLIPAILGNFSLKPVDIPEIPHSTVMNVVTYISKFPSSEAFLTSVSDEHQLLDNQFRKAKEQYTVVAKDPRNLDEFAKLGHLPQWVLERFRQGCFQIFMLGALEFGYCTLRPVVEDLDRPSSHLTGRSLRQSIYGILGCHGPVTETLREYGIQVVDTKVEPKLPPPIMLADISKLEPHGGELKRIFHSVLDFDTPIQEAIEKLPKEWQLVAISLKFCFRQCDPAMTLDSIKALVACFLSCSSCKDTRTATLKRGSSELKALHGFAQWQCVHFDVIALNQLMCEPYEYVSPAKLFDGQVAMHYATLFRNDHDTVVKEAAGYDLELSEQIYNIVTDQRVERKPKTERKKRCVPQVGDEIHYNISTHNRYAELPELGSDEY